MKRNWKRVLSALLVVCMTAALLPMALAAEPTSDAMDAFVEKGYVVGYADGSLGESQAMTRAELAVLVNRLLGAKSEADLSAYTDVVAGAWYYSDLAQAVTAGYLTGTSDTTLEPSTALTAESAAEILTAAFGTTITPDSASREDIVEALYPLTVGEEGYTYVLMNIPYADFYAGEGDADVDAVSSATMSKPKSSTRNIAGGSYHVNEDGSDISGITYPVAVPEGTDLSACKQVTDADSYSIETTMRGNTSTTVYVGKDALFQNESYAYYELAVVPSVYKVLSVNEDGSFSFSEVKAEAQTVEVAVSEFLTDTTYGDYQINLDTDALNAAIGENTLVSGVVLTTTDGTAYGLRQLENIWTASKLAWSVGYVTTTHGCTLSYEPYADIQGKTIDTITYYTTNGVYAIDVDIYVPVKFATTDAEGNATLAVADAAIAAGTTTVDVSCLPEDYEAEYSIEGETDATCDGTAVTWTTAAPGEYTLNITDKSGKYASVSTTFVLSTDTLPVEASENAVVKTEAATDEEYAAYLSAISSVTIGETEYSASGRGAVAVIGEDGAVDFTTSAFTELAGQTVTATVAATGYPALELTITVPETLPEAESTESAH